MKIIPVLSAFMALSLYAAYESASPVIEDSKVDASKINTAPTGIPFERYESDKFRGTLSAGELTSDDKEAEEEREKPKEKRINRMGPNKR